LAGLSVFLTGASAALAAAAWGGGATASRTANTLVFVCAAVAVLGGMATGLLMTLRYVRLPARLARHVEALLPELGDSVRSAVGLASEADPAGMSASLRRAHLNATTQRLIQPAMRARHLRETLRRTRPFLGLLVSSLIVITVTLVTAQDRTLLGLGRAWRSPVAEGDRAEALPPLWSDVSVTLNYPDYMMRQPLVLDGISGDITAPRGTEVLLRARADRTVKTARLLMPSGEVAMQVASGRALTATFTINDSGRYRVALTTPSGDDVTEDPGHLLTVEPDNAPGVELVDPDGDKTVLPTDKIPLTWKTRDDYGITELTLVVRNLRKGGEPERRPLPSPKDQPKEASGRFTLDVSKLAVRPGDRVIISVEARDNDTVSGPKTGQSANRTLKIFSAAEHHNELIAKQEALLKRMVVQLADEMESPLTPPEDTAAHPPDMEADRWAAQVKRGQDLGAALQTLAEEFFKDELAPPEVARALKNIRVDLMRPYDEMALLTREIVTQVRTSLRFPEPYTARTKRLAKTAVQKLEQHILYMEDLIGRQRLFEAEEAARELASTQERLRELLKKFKEAGDEETRKQILEEMNALRQQLKELSQKLAQLQRDIPQEYVNMDALQDKDLQDPMNDIDKMLAEGDIEGAAKALEDMAKTTEQLLKEMQKSQDEYGGEDFAELREKLETFKQEMDDITQQQEGLLQESRSRLERARERARKELGEDPEQFAQRLQKEAEELVKNIKDMNPNGLLEMESEQRQEAEARAEDTARALKARDFEEAQKSVQQLQSTLEYMRTSVADRTEGRFATGNKETRKAKDKLDQATPRARKLAEQLNKLMPDPSEHMTPEEKQAMQESARRQGRLGERARQLGAQMEEIGKDAPIFNQEHKDGVEGARREMQNAQGDLQGQDLPGATGRQREALGRMQQLQKSLAEMGKGGSGGGGMPLPFGDGQGSGGRDGSGRGQKQQRVEIPDADQFKVPQQFRKDILDAMKENAPNRYQGEVKQYYEELVK